jgi:hypothetical protein
MRPQPLIAVTDVEASSRWYQHSWAAKVPTEAPTMSGLCAAAS